MKSKHLGAIVLIIVGIVFLSKNLNIFPRPQVSWPLILILLGLVALYQTGSKPKSDSPAEGEVIWEVNGSSPGVRRLVALPVLFIVLIFALIIFGLVGPLFLLFLVFVPLILFLKVGWFFLRLLLPIVFAAFPLLLILWILTLIF